jgi:hypothetical protein
MGHKMFQSALAEAGEARDARLHASRLGAHWRLWLSLGGRLRQRPNRLARLCRSHVLSVRPALRRRRAAARAAGEPRRRASPGRRRRDRQSGRASAGSSSRRPRGRRGHRGATVRSRRVLRGCAGRRRVRALLRGKQPRLSELPAIQSCAAETCQDLEQAALEACWNTCTSETAAVCAEGRAEALLDGAFSWVVPWTERLSFGGSTELARSEIEVLYSPEACLERFPTAPTPPCNDVVESHFLCSAALAKLAAAKPGQLGAWLALVLSLTFVRLRRRKA